MANYKIKTRGIMRTLHIATLVSTVAVFLLQVCSLHAQSNEDATLILTDSQMVDCTTIGSFESDREPVNTILEEDYPYLKSIDCLKNRNFVDSRGWNFSLKHRGTGQATHYVLRGKGARINVKATYDNNGNLVESILHTQYTWLPPAIRQFIISGKYDGWVMIGNEKIVKDFDPYQTEYNIILSDGRTEQVLNFKEYGNTIAFSGNYIKR